MIKPVSIGLRVLAILGTALLQMVTAPINAVGHIMTILAEEVLQPIVSQFIGFTQNLEKATK